MFQGDINSAIFTILHLYYLWTTETPNHSSYLSQPPQPAVVYFFSAGVLFRIMNAKFWPILSHCDQVRLYFRECKHFLVYFLQAHIMWWCIKIDKYGVWIRRVRVMMMMVTDLIGNESCKAWYWWWRGSGLKMAPNDQCQSACVSRWAPQRTTLFVGHKEQPGLIFGAQGVGAAYGVLWAPLVCVCRNTRA